MSKSFLVLVSALVLLASSCKKDSGTPVTVADLVGTYAFSRIILQQGNAAETDATDTFFNDCAKDDLISLQATHTYTAIDAGTPCGNGNTVGNWELLGDNTLKLGNDIYTIRKFDGTNLELSRTGNDNGVATTLVTYYVKQ